MVVRTALGSGGGSGAGVRVPPPPPQPASSRATASKLQSFRFLTLSSLGEGSIVTSSIYMRFLPTGGGNLRSPSLNSIRESGTDQLTEVILIRSILHVYGYCLLYTSD